MSRSSTTSIAGHDRAFTLVEVMVGILILGLGILGLGAIFPAVAIQQRSAADAVEGQTAADAAESILRGHGTLNSLYINSNSPPDYGAWTSSLVAPGNIGGTWDAPTPSQNLVQIDPRSGDITIGQGVSAVTLTAQQRLYPAVTPPANGNPFAGARFVWDMVARRAPRADYRDPPDTSISAPKWLEYEKLQDRIQVAVFVRRIDSGIRYRPGNSYVPVAQDVATGLATLDGVGAGTNVPYYAPIRKMELKPDFSNFPGYPTVQPPAGAKISRVMLNEQALPAGMTAANTDAVIGQVGQKFVVQVGTGFDATGMVVTVTNVERTTGTPPLYSILTIDPAIPLQEFPNITGTPSAPALFTAQPPVAIRFFTLRDGGVN